MANKFMTNKTWQNLTKNGKQILWSKKFGKKIYGTQ